MLKSLYSLRDDEGLPAILCAIKCHNRKPDLITPRKTH